jgi:hypothetical protein
MFRTLSVSGRVLLAAALLVGGPGFPLLVRAAEDESHSVWPQEFKEEGTKLVFFQPQWETLDNSLLRGRAALGVTPKGKSTPVFGAVWLETDVKIKEDARKVKTGDLRVTRVHLPDASASEEEHILALAREAAPGIDLDLDLNTLEAAVQASRQEREQAAQLNMAPPRILFEAQPAFLVVLDGDPKEVRVQGTSLERVVNTPFFIVRDTQSGRYYMDGGGRWYESKSLKSSWKAIDEPPDKVMEVWKKGTQQAASADPHDAEARQKATDAQAAVKKKGPPPTPVISTEPAELIVTQGDPKFAPLAGGDLLYLSNTPNDVLMDVSSQQYFVLLSGRWYRGKALTGPWEYVRPDMLPDAFAKIPPSSPKGNVLTSVTGTPAAEEAVADAAVPQMAEVQKNEAQLTVEYDGAPQFKKIPGTSVEYAINTTAQVLHIGDKYYAVDQGIWFVADSPEGPWVVSDETPPGLDAIPPSSPAYNTKYVYVYGSTPSSVYTGYYPGYLGAYPWYGTLVWGTGWYYPGWWGHYYYPYPATFGFGATYSSGYGWSFGFGVGFGWGYPGYGYPYYGYYPWHPFYPAYAWGYPGWWGPYGHCYYGGHYGGYYGGRYVQPSVAAGGLAAHLASAVPGIPASRLPQGTNVNLYRDTLHPNGLVTTHDKFASRAIGTRTAMMAGRAPVGVSPAPGRVAAHPAPGGGGAGVSGQSAPRPVRPHAGVPARPGRGAASVQQGVSPFTRVNPGNAGGGGNGNGRVVPGPRIGPGGQRIYPGRPAPPSAAGPISRPSTSMAPRGSYPGMYGRPGSNGGVVPRPGMVGPYTPRGGTYAPHYGGGSVAPPHMGGGAPGGGYAPRGGGMSHGGGGAPRGGAPHGGGHR